MKLGTSLEFGRVMVGVWKLGDREKAARIEPTSSIPKRIKYKMFWQESFYFFSDASSLLFTSSQFTIFQKASTNLALSFL